MRLKCFVFGPTKNFSPKRRENWERKAHEMSFQKYPWNSPLSLQRIGFFFFFFLWDMLASFLHFFYDFFWMCSFLLLFIFYFIFLFLVLICLFSHWFWLVFVFRKKFWVNFLCFFYFYWSVHLDTIFLKYNMLLFVLFNRDMMVNLYKLYFQPNKKVFHPLSTFPPSQPNTNEGN